MANARQFMAARTAAWAKSGGGISYDFVESIKRLSTQNTGGGFPVYQYLGLAGGEYLRDIEFRFSCKLKVDRNSDNLSSLFSPVGGIVIATGIGVGFLNNSTHHNALVVSFCTRVTYAEDFFDDEFHDFTGIAEGGFLSVNVDGVNVQTASQFTGTSKFSTGSNGGSAGILQVRGGSTAFLGDFSINDYHFKPILAKDGRVGFVCLENGDLLLTDDAQFSAIPFS